MKLGLEEPESAALETFVRTAPTLAASRVILVEVSAALARAELDDALSTAEALSEGLVLVDVSAALLREAAALAGRSPLRALDAIHLASALTVEAGEMLVYDRRLAEAAGAAGLTVLSPGA